MSHCKDCGCWFQPKNPWQSRCWDCWAESKGYRNTHNTSADDFEQYEKPKGKTTAAWDDLFEEQHPYEKYQEEVRKDQAEAKAYRDYTDTRKPDPAVAEVVRLGKEILKLQTENRKLRMKNIEIARMLVDAEMGHRQQSVNASIPEDMMRRLIQLCHPDKHNGSEAANKVAVWLNQQREKQ